MTMSCNWWETAGCNLLVFAVATAVTFQHGCLACSRDFCFCAKEDAEDQANRAAASKLNNPGFDEEADEREDEDMADAPEPPVDAMSGPPALRTHAERI